MMRYQQHRHAIRMMASCVAGLGVWKCASMSRLAAASAVTPPACAVPIAVFAFWLANTRSMARREAQATGYWLINVAALDTP